MELLELRAVGFRNLAAEPVHLDPGTNLVLGPNGAGKTSLLEAVAVLGNLRSFRTSRVRRTVSHGASGYLLEGTVRRGGRTFRLAHQLDTGPPLVRRLSVDGRDAGVGEYLRELPVTTLTADDRELVTGPPAVRRAFLDRSAFLLDPPVLDEVRRYRHVLRQRNAALAAGAPDDAVEPWDSSLAAAAAVVVDRRRRLVARIREAVVELVGDIGSRSIGVIEPAYRGDPELPTGGGVEELEKEYRQRYNVGRARDRQMGFTVEGPHRHELDLRVDGRPVRDVLSSGQTKVVAAALRLAALAEIEARLQERTPIVIDDVDAELDVARLSGLVSRLGDGRQLLLSSAHHEVVVPRLEAAVPLWMERGACGPREREQR